MLFFSAEENLYQTNKTRVEKRYSHLLPLAGFLFVINLIIYTHCE